MAENEEMFWGMPQNTFCMLMHLSQLSSFVIPGAGLVMPLVMWLTQKDKNSVIDMHGKNIFNWMISAFIYMLICLPLCLIYIGILGLFALGLMGLIFAIVGGVKANDGQIWAYPLSIKFFKAKKAIEEA